MIDNNSGHSNSIDCELYAENSDGKLIIKNLECNNYFMTTAQKILADKKLLQRFSPQHVARIKLFATF